MNRLSVFLHCLWWSLQPWRWPAGVSHRHCVVRSDFWVHHFCECGYKTWIFDVLEKARRGDRL